MTDKMDKELKEFDSFLSKIEKEDMVVPDALEGRIREKGKKLRKSVPAYAKLATTAAVLVAVFCSAVLWVPGFAAYAADIPGLGTFVEWVKGDRGVEYAREHDYGTIDGVTIYRDGYNIKIDNIFFDEDRLTFKVATNGPYVEEMLQDTTQHVSINVNFVDFEEIGGFIMGYNESRENKMIIVEAEKAFNEGEVTRFLIKDPVFLNLQVGFAIYKDSSKIDGIMEDVQIPFSQDKVLKSVSYALETQIPVTGNHLIQGIQLLPEQLTISPTRIRLLIEADMPEGFEFADFENPRLKDKNGKVYTAEGLSARHLEVNKRALYFVPSVYFNIPEVLTFHYDGIRFRQKEDSSFILKMDDVYPRTISYMGEELVIHNVRYHNGKLQINIDFPDPDILRIQDLEIEGSTSRGSGFSQTMSEDGDKSLRATLSEYWIGVDERDEYEVSFGYPGYLIKEPGQLKINLR